MKINRNNYESFFLLYIDNELSAEEKTEVENFLLKNSDLSDEFDLLRDTKLADEGLTIFEHKELLYKSTALHIDTENCEEWFLLYTDNELSTDEKESVDRWLSNNPTYKPALEVLLHTQMPKETIVFSTTSEEIIKPVSFLKKSIFSSTSWSSSKNLEFFMLCLIYIDIDPEGVILANSSTGLAVVVDP